jgi:hypothetical protein
MLRLQGDRVLLVDGAPRRSGSLILTIVQVVDVNKRELMLINREDKSREAWPLTQDLMDRFVPLKNDPTAKWKLTL